MTHRTVTISHCFYPLHERCTLRQKPIHPLKHRDWCAIPRTWY